MKTFLDYLKTHHGVGLQIWVTGADGKPKSKSGDVVDYDENGVVFAIREGQNQILEAYPWTAIHGLLTTLNPKTLA